MRIRDLAIVFLSLTVALPALCEEVKLKTVVLGVKARRGVEKGLAAAMTDVLHGELNNDPARSVFSRADLERVLQFEADKQSVGCDSDSCLAEVASAMDADRIINGTMDKIGSKYFVVVTEIDARNIEPVARVQERVPANEDELIDAMIKISRKLMISGAASGVPKGPRTNEATLDGEPGKGAVGVAMLRSEPPGLEVFYEGQSIGKTPLRVPGVPAGRAKFETKLEDGGIVPLDIPVTDGKTTEVRTELNMPDVVTAQDIEDYEFASTAHWISTWVSLGAGTGVSALVVVFGVVGGLMAYFAPAIWYIYLPVLGTGCLSCVAGCALLGWGGYKIFTPPDEPAPGGELVHRIQIKTPDGTVKMREISVAAALAGEVTQPSGSDASGEADAEAADGDATKDETSADDGTDADAETSDAAGDEGQDPGGADLSQPDDVGGISDAPEEADGSWQSMGF